MIRFLWEAFWRWVCRFAFRRLGGPQERIPVGIPTIRDPDHRCASYEPRERELRDWTGCHGDSHYLCVECCHYVGPETDYCYDGKRGP